LANTPPGGWLESPAMAPAMMGNYPESWLPPRVAPPADGCPTAPPDPAASQIRSWEVGRRGCTGSSAESLQAVAPTAGQHAPSNTMADCPGDEFHHENLQ